MSECVKGICIELLKTAGAYKKSLWKSSRKTLWRGQPPPSPLLTYTSEGLNSARYLTLGNKKAQQMNKIDYSINKHIFSFRFVFGPNGLVVDLNFVITKKPCCRNKSSLLASLYKQHRSAPALTNLTETPP